MSQVLAEEIWDAKELIANLVTEDDEPVDSILSAKQQRLLVESLYSSWQPPTLKDASGEPRKFLADSNVGIFYSRHQPPIVPDAFISLDVEANAEWFADAHCSYFVWEFDKVPEVAVEIVSNRKGGEMDAKMRRYAQMDVGYYVVFDPFRVLGEDALQVYERALWKRYRRREDFKLPELELSLKLWRGVFEGVEGEWLRWRDANGNLLLTGIERAGKEAERADKEAERADKETARAEREAERADSESERAARLAAKLREMGVDPNQI